MKNGFILLTRESLYWLRSKREILLLLLIVAVGSFLRIYDLGIESLWLDEIISIDCSLNDIATIIANRASNGHTPLYFIILHFWMGIFGTGEAAVRSLSAVFGILAIPSIYLVGREMFNGKTGLIAGVLSSISYFHIFYSQEARPYSLLLFMTLLSYYFFIKLLKEGRNWHYAFYCVTTLLLGYTHVYGIFVIASQIFYFLLFWKRLKPQRNKLLVSLIAVIISLIPLAVLMVPRAIFVSQHELWISKPSLMTLLQTFTLYAGSGKYQYILLLLFAILVLISPFYIQKTAGKWLPGKPLESLNSFRWNTRFVSIEDILLILIWLFLPLLIPYIMSYITTPFFVNKYTMGASPALYILAAKGISNINTKKLIYPLIIIIIIFSYPGLYSYYTNDVKEQWREAAETVEINTQQNDVLLFCVPYVRKPFEYYYQGSLDKFWIDNNVDDVQELANFVNETTNGKDRLWLITSHGGQTAPISNYLKETYYDTIVLEQEFKGVQVLLIEIRQDD